MARSEQITDLVKALSEAQAEMASPKKGQTAKAGSYSYNYASLAEIKDAYRTVLGKRGLAVSHAMAPVDGHILLTTTLYHTSGQWISSECPIPVYSKAQEQGSALSYFKRYNVCALLDIVAEDDDDGAAAQAAEPKKPEPKPEPAKPKPTEPCLSAADIKGEIGSAAKAAGFASSADMADLLEGIAGVRTLREFPARFKDDLLAALARLKEQKVREQIHRDVDEMWPEGKTA